MRDEWVMVAIDVCVYTIQSLEHLLDCRLESLWEGRADAGGEDGFIVDKGLRPRHEMLNILWGGHFGWFGITCCCVLPKVFKSEAC